MLAPCGTGSVAILRFWQPCFHWSGIARAPFSACAQVLMLVKAESFNQALLKAKSAMLWNQESGIKVQESWSKQIGCAAFPVEGTTGRCEAGLQ